MALANSYVQIYGQLPAFFKTISEGQAPERFTRQHLKDIGHGASNFRAAIPLLKVLGFLTAEGSPTERYKEYRNKARSKYIMAEALKEAYSDLFVIKAKPTEADRDLIEGKFKSTHNTSENVARLMANTFFALASLADFSEESTQSHVKVQKPETEKQSKHSDDASEPSNSTPKLSPTLHYNIQIHLPATKDIEVFNAIFKSLREHLIS